LLEPPAPATDAGVLDGAAPDAAPPPSTPNESLVLRYDFEGTGGTVVDRAGNADAVLRGGARLDGSGGVELDGVDDYVDLPNGVLSRLSSTTIAAFLTWHGGLCWQRVFDFGSNTGGEGNVGRGLTSLYLTPLSCGYDVLFAAGEIDAARYGLGATEPLATDRPVFVALTFESPAGEISLYLDGRLVGRIVVPFELSEIDDVNNWLGRSQWVQDYELLRARYDELRMYDRALSAQEIAELHTRGPDAP
jgi:hypothetical protein